MPDRVEKPLLIRTAVWAQWILGRWCGPRVLYVVCVFLLVLLIAGTAGTLPIAGFAAPHLWSVGRRLTVIAVTFVVGAGHVVRVLVAGPDTVETEDTVAVGVLEGFEGSLLGGRALRSRNVVALQRDVVLLDLESEGADEGVEGEVSVRVGFGA